VIHTVLGPIEPDQLGVTSMHEHVLSDARGLADDPDYRLDDPGLAVAELALAAGSGLRSVVDLTGWGFGGPAPALAEISRASGIQIVAGVGIYLGRTRPAWLSDLGPDELAELFHSALTDTLPGCGFSAGIIGVIAPDHPISGADRDILRAAACAARMTHSAVVLRLDPRYDDGPELIEFITGTGLEPSEVVLSNIDGYVAAADEVLDRLADSGATLKWCFGYEAPPRAGLRSATDAARANAIVRLLARGCERQVLACGVWTRAALLAHGGFGYRHLMTTAVPLLHARGLSAQQLHGLLVEQPRRLLDRGAPA
jgi:phosphotriesterase-related protein